MDGLLPNLAATAYYVIANSTTQTITSTDATFLSPVPVASLPNPATAAVITPDGKLLAVAASTLHLFSTSTNTEVVSGGLSQGSDITTFDVASSLDASRLFALGSTTAGGSQLTAYNTATLAVTGNLAILQAATAVAVGPNGLVYVSVADEILEINPATLQQLFRSRPFAPVAALPALAW